VTDKEITQALEKFARRQLLGGHLRRAWSWIFANRRYRAGRDAIKAESFQKAPLKAGVRMWISEVRRTSERKP
jgi:hypothetical protein